MNSRALKTLEYNKIIDTLTIFADSEPGRVQCKNLTPMIDVDDIRQAQTRTQDSLTRIYRNGAPYFGGVHDLRPIFLRLDVESVLGTGELLMISTLLRCVKNSIEYNKKTNTKTDNATDKTYEDAETGDSLTELFETLVPLTTLAREIDRCIISEEEISDEASPGLKSVRRSMKNMNSRIHDAIGSILNKNRSLLQDSLITTRNGRYCLPVKAEHKSAIPGMVHDQSSTGSTLFIEPLEVIKLNNELVQLEAKEHEEIEKILATLSAMSAEHTEEIKLDYEILSELDFIFAKGKLARNMKASMPTFNEDGYINLKKARHPLIDPQKVVPIDVHIGDGFRHLIITGPNTGGKTVTLKTVGLLTLLGQAGLHIPAVEGSTLSVFEDVFADIGDEQSIEQSLSTFSSHMTNIVYILKHANYRSLILFDELGAGTDPEEGAALAMSILIHLLRKNITTLATTHYSELKLYALEADNVENASCEFDVATLRPTYRLLIGIPGKSNAFAISKKLGLPDYIIRNAAKNIDVSNKNFEDVLGNLEKNRIEMEQKQEEIDAAKIEIDQLKKKLKEKNERIDKAKDKILRRANEEARDILQKAKDQADESIKQYNKIIKEAGISNTDAGKEMEKTRQGLRDAINEKDSSLAIKTKKQKNTKITKDNIAIGTNVHIISLGIDGVITSLPNNKDMVGVSMGAMNTNVHITDLMLIEKEDNEPEQPKIPVNTYNLSKAANISPELNLIGKTVDEAIMELDKYLDDAYLSNLSRVTIIHGRGTGALRNAVHSHLRHVKYVKSYRIGGFGEGDHGVTIVDFKEQGGS